MALRDDGVLPLPADVDIEQASMLCVNPLTVMGMLEGVSPGATIVINAGTSAVSKRVLAVARLWRGIAVVTVVTLVRVARAADLHRTPPCRRGADVHGGPPEAHSVQQTV